MHGRAGERLRGTRRLRVAGEGKELRIGRAAFEAREEVAKQLVHPVAA
jgi:hypothetical protein